MPVNPLNDHDDPQGSGDPLLGELVGGRYRVSHVLGEGGMGVVYAGEHAELGRKVAIKVIRPEVARDGRATERFLREARTASQLGHPNIVDVFDLGRLPDGRPYMVMPRLKGMDCEAMLRERGPQPPARVAEILSGAASGLDAMHAHGLVHRDVKPENLFLAIHDDGGETTKVMDFGLAALQNVGSRLTKVGTILGTPHYMPPECATGEKAGVAADVYALAVVAFEMIAGHLPFDGENPTYLLASKMTTDAPKLSELAAQPISPALDDLFARALSRRPHERPESCGAFIEELREAAAAAPDATSATKGTEELALTFSEPPPPPAAAPDGPPADPPATGPVAPRLDLESGPVPRPPQRRRGPLLALALLAAVAALTVGVLVRGGGDGDTEAEGAGSTETVAEPSAPTAAPAPPQPETVAPPDPVVAHRAETRPPDDETPRPQRSGGSASEEPGRRRLGVPRSPRTEARATGPAPSQGEPALPQGPAGTASPPTTNPPTAEEPRAEEPRAEEPAAEEPRAEEPTTTTDAPARVPVPSADVARARSLTAEGNRLALRGRLPEAIERYRDATLAAPGHAPAWRGLGIAYERLGNTADARRSYERYLRLRPNGADAQEVRARLDRL